MLERGRPRLAKFSDEVLEESLASAHLANLVSTLDIVDDLDHTADGQIRSSPRGDDRVRNKHERKPNALKLVAQDANHLQSQNVLSAVIMDLKNDTALILLLDVVVGACCRAGRDSQRS